MLVKPNPQNTLSVEDEVTGVLRDLVDLEVSLGHEVDHLRSIHVPSDGSGQQTHYCGKPTWWWRFRLLTWIHTQEAGGSTAGDLLRGLRISLKQWDDAALLRFLKQIGRNGSLQQRQSRGRRGA